MRFSTARTTRTARTQILRLGIRHRSTSLTLQSKLIMQKIQMAQARATAAVQEAIKAAAAFSYEDAAPGKVSKHHKKKKKRRKKKKKSAGGHEDDL